MYLLSQIINDNIFGFYATQIRQEILLQSPSSGHSDYSSPECTTVTLSQNK